jgi:hypothetical protein
LLEQQHSRKAAFDLWTQEQIQSCGKRGRSTKTGEGESHFHGSQQTDDILCVDAATSIL